jgi:hypothetical protein
MPPSIGASASLFRASHTTGLVELEEVGEE